MTEQQDGPSTGLRGLDFKPGYDSGDRVLETFYIPALSRAVQYDRSVGYFRSSALSVAARGISRFINSGGTVRLLCGAAITAADRDALTGRSSLDGVFAQRLTDALVTEDEVDRRRLEVLAWLAQENRLQVRIAIAVDGDGQPVVGGDTTPYFHEKIGILRDTAGDGIAFQGSINESAQAWTRNFESFSVYSSWRGSAEYFSHWQLRFEDHWAGRTPGFRVYPLPDAARQRLLSLAPDVAPDERDPEEPAVVGDDATIVRYLHVAPKLLGAEELPAATTGVTLFPHQLQVVERLAGMYPRSWLVADEVGLGKTISAGMALRRLLLSGRVQRALILAPANVCRQWQDELFEKFGLWVPRLDAGRILGAHPDDIGAVGDANPWASQRVLIASSHLARRPAEQDRLIDAGPYDLVIVDEAHHARRTHIHDQEYRPGRLLELLDKISSNASANALWLLTATPMQVDPIELRDLLVHAGLQGPLAVPTNFLRFFRELGKDDDASVAWEWLHEMLHDTVRLPLTGAEHALLERLRVRLGPVDVARIEQFGVGEGSGRQIANELSTSGRIALREWLTVLGPVGQFVTRHSRETLHIYRRRGLLTENLAERDTRSIGIQFTSEEQALYDELEEWIDRLNDAHGTGRGAGFILTVYRRRLTSSWAAIQSTLRRRLDREQLALDDDDAVEELERHGLETGQGYRVNDIQALPLTEEDISDARAYISKMETVADSKFLRLRSDLDTVRSAGHSTIVFTQYTDTLNSIRDRLVGSYRSQLATFTGEGGKMYRDGEGWVDVSKRELVDAVRSRMVTILLANDAASEGLNLQACSYLVNYDMPWNPMRVEQRIGRVDRLGQARDVVHIRSYFIPHTVEEQVYSALANRIDNFRLLLGKLQPILGATEAAFREIFRAPRSERRAAQDSAIRAIMDQIEVLQHEGIEFSDEDPLPAPRHPPTPVDLEDLRRVLVDRFAAVLGSPERPVTFDPSRTSRDPDAWTALATYGHPEVNSLLGGRAAVSRPARSALVLSEGERWPRVAVRADRTPPEPVRSLADVDALGPAIARGEAEELANSLRIAALGAQRRHEAQLVGARKTQALDGIRGQFIQIVHAAIAGGCAASRAGGASGVDPAAIWLDLKAMRKGGWSYAEATRQRLNVPTVRLIPAYLVSQMDPISDDEWQIQLRALGKEMQQLIPRVRLALLSDLD